MRPNLIFQRSFLVLSVVILTLMSTQSFSKPMEESGKPTSLVSQAVLHPCFGIKGAPYRKYQGFVLKSGTLFKYKNLLGDPKTESSSVNTVEEFFIVKGILSKDGSKVLCREGADYTQTLAELGSEPEDVVSSKPPKKSKKTKKAPKEENQQAGQQQQGQPVSDHENWVYPLTNNISDYYAGLDLENLKDSQLKHELFKILSSSHIQSKGKADEVVESCPNEIRDGEKCISQRIFNYKAIRKLMFGFLDLRVKETFGDGKSTFEMSIVDVYCQREVKADDFIKVENQPEIYNIPNHTILNTEHTWPQSRFNPLFPKTMQKTDLHHLFPTESKHNGARGHKEFATIGNDSKKIKVTCEGNRVGTPKEVPGLETVPNKVYYEVPDAHKGNAARAIFYFSVRYNMAIDSVEEHFLREWHKIDPVDDSERNRTDIIYDIQGNRNPFVDYPEFVDNISDF